MDRLLDELLEFLESRRLEGFGTSDPRSLKGWLDVCAEDGRGRACNEADRKAVSTWLRSPWRKTTLKRYRVGPLRKGEL